MGGNSSSCSSEFSCDSDDDVRRKNSDGEEEVRAHCLSMNIDVDIETW
jgi:hypothetical protein